MGSLLMHAFTTITLIFFPTLGFLVFLLVFLVFFLFRCCSLYLFVFFVPLYCACLWPFILPVVTRFTIFTPYLLLACCGCPSKTAHWSANCLATTNTLCWSCHVSFPNKSSFCFVFYFLLHSHPDKGWASLLPTPIACT